MLATDIFALLATEVLGYNLTKETGSAAAVVSLFLRIILAAFIFFLRRFRDYGNALGNLLPSAQGL